MYSCDDKSEFVAFLLQSSVPRDDLFEKKYFAVLFITLLSFFINLKG